MDRKEAEELLHSKGFQNIVEYNDPPHAHFPDHNHEMIQGLVVLKGSITLTMSGKTGTYNEGDYFYFPAQEIHEAKVGPEGCTYLVGENIDLD